MRIKQIRRGALGVALAIAVYAVPSAASGAPGSLRLTLDQAAAGRLAAHDTLPLPFGLSNMSGGVSVTGDPDTGLPVVSISPGATFIEPTTNSFATRGLVYGRFSGGFSFTYLDLGRVVHVTDFTVSLFRSVRFTKLYASIDNFIYGQFAFLDLDLSHAKWTSQHGATKVSGIRASVDPSASSSLNAAFGTAAFSSASRFATLDITVHR
jgi:hypothetical protein